MNPIDVVLRFLSLKKPLTRRFQAMKIILPLLVAAAVIFTAGVAYAALDNPHDFNDKECQRCHLDLSGHPKAMRSSVSHMCEDCHKNISRKPSHPVNRSPRAARVPKDLPLQRGRITCNTCHDVHASRLSSSGTKSYLLRRPVTGMEFCLSCHRTQRFAGSHGALLAVAHMGSRYAAARDAGSLDRLSSECLTCHDGSMGKAVPCRLVQGVCNRGTGAHPVGMVYRESRMRDRKLVPASLLDRRLKLFDGKVGCGTCHNLYSRLPKKLARSNDGSGLCLSCHRK